MPAVMTEDDDHDDAREQGGIPKGSTGLVKRMSPHGSDDLDTPAAAFAYLAPYLRAYCLRSHTKAIIWEPAPGRGALVKAMEDAGFDVYPSAEGYDFLEKGWLGCPDAITNILVTNPPFSKKAEFLRVCGELGMPIALLLPVTTLGSRKCQIALDSLRLNYRRKNGTEDHQRVEVIFLPKRIDFTGKKAPWFSVAWFTRGLGLGRQIVFPESLYDKDWPGFPPGYTGFLGKPKKRNT